VVAGSDDEQGGCPDLGEAVAGEVRSSAAGHHRGDVRNPAAASGRYEAVSLGFGGEARAVNSHGQIVGEGWLSADAKGSHGFLWSRGKLTDLGVLEAGDGEYGRATDVNDRGEVVGFSVFRVDPEQSAQHAFLWRNGVLTDIDQVSLDSMAAAINNRGQVVGTRYTADGAYAFLWQAGVMTNLGTGYAWDINDRGQVVGQNNLGATGATMWYRGRAYDLGAPAGLDDWRPTAINERGWIAGNGGVMAGRAYLWRSWERSVTRRTSRPGTTGSGRPET
jgi:probable HAF family extracellular repeat protein